MGPVTALDDQKQRIFAALGEPKNVWPPLTIPILSLSGQPISDLKIVNWSLTGDFISSNGGHDVTFYCPSCDGTLLVHGCIVEGEVQCPHGLWQRLE